jgi:hypothetical protein
MPPAMTWSAVPWGGATPIIPMILAGIEFSCSK